MSLLKKTEHAHFAGTQIRATGIARPGMPTTHMEGIPFLVSTMEPVARPAPAEGRHISITGVLMPTVEAGGWTVTDAATQRKSLLFDIEQFKGQPWFREGRRVRVHGDVRPGMPNPYMEGIPLVVTEMERVVPSPF
ncbi:MAG TPA: hypothetical protein V6D17_04925 [Candidatus Obscuribacterales bacterium]